MIVVRRWYACSRLDLHLRARRPWLVTWTTVGSGCHLGIFGINGLVMKLLLV